MKISAFVLGGCAVRDPLEACSECVTCKALPDKVLKNSRQVRIMVGLILLLGQ